MCSCPFCRYRYIRLPFGATLAGDMFQKEIDKLLFSSLQDVFCIADEVLIPCFDEQDKDHKKSLEKVLWACRQENLKLNKDKCLPRCTSIPFFGEIISHQGVNLDPRKAQVPTDISPSKFKRNCNHSLVY